MIQLMLGEEAERPENLRKAQSQFLAKSCFQDYRQALDNEIRYFAAEKKADAAKNARER